MDVQHQRLYTGYSTCRIATLRKLGVINPEKILESYKEVLHSKENTLVDFKDEDDNLLGFRMYYETPNGKHVHSTTLRGDLTLEQIKQFNLVTLSQIEGKKYGIHNTQRDQRAIEFLKKMGGVEKNISDYPDIQELMNAFKDHMSEDYFNSYVIISSS